MKAESIRKEIEKLLVMYDMAEDKDSLFAEIRELDMRHAVLLDPAASMISISAGASVIGRAIALHFEKDEFFYLVN